jgi:hypothetical protein
VHGAFQASDVWVIALMGIGVYGFFQSESRISPIWRWTLAVSSLGLTLAWAQAVVHGLDQRVPLLSAMLFGREFLFFALLLPVAPYILSSRREITRFVVTLDVLVTFFSAAMIAASVHLIPSSFVNAYQVHTDGPTVRIYTKMQELIALGFTCALGYRLLGARRYRAAATTALIVCAGAVILLLTRALYIGLIAGIVACALTWGTGYSRPSSYVRKRMALIVVGMLIIGVGLVVFAPSVLDSSALQAISSRFTAGLENLQGQGTGTVQLREHLASFELRLLGGHWPFGLGFLPPSVYYVASLPSGDIMDVDLGVLQAVITMGVIGAVFIYLPVLMTTIKLTRPLIKAGGQFQWLRLGIYIWLVSVLVSSLTLDTLFSETGIILTTLVLGVAIRVDTLERPGGKYQDA